jgi:alpha-glucosidase (family GH31 glycosyl hydrolase)
MLLYFYSQLQIAEKYGTPMFLPAYMHFPEDAELTKDYEQTVMIGDALLVAMPLTSADEF